MGLSFFGIRAKKEVLKATNTFVEVKVLSNEIKIVQEELMAPLS
jgi:hypothetical protein